MVRYAAGHAEATRKRIIKAASRRFRRDGIEASGVAALMSEVGLTHGGFYAHFRSKDDLLHAALQACFDDTLGRLEKAARAGPPDEAAGRVADLYLTEEHRDRPDYGCAAAALVTEAPRRDADTQAIFSRQVDRMIEILAATVDAPDAERRGRAMAAVATMIGAMALSRVMAGKADSAAMLDAARAAVREIAGRRRA